MTIEEKAPFQFDSFLNMKPILSWHRCYLSLYHLTFNKEIKIDIVTSLNIIHSCNIVVMNLLTRSTSLLYYSLVIQNKILFTVSETVIFDPSPL